MSQVAALLAGCAVFLLLRPAGKGSLTNRLAIHLAPRPSMPDPGSPDPEATLRQAGLSWTRGELGTRRLAAAGLGAFIGILLAQGDLFVAPPGRSAPGLAVLGAAAGWLSLRMWITTRRERRSDRLRQELPTVADTLALHVVAGESVVTALERFTGSASGVAAEEMASALRTYRAGTGLSEAMAAAARDTAHPEAARLHHLLAHAHTAGGKLADSLADLAVDYRAALARDLTAEGGRRALATYGPILALMVPTAFVFLMYPTIVGLRQLAGGP